MAFPIIADLEFFQSTQRVPAWANRIQAKREIGHFASIDNVISAHAGVRDTPGEMSAHNLLVLVRSFLRRNKDIVHELQKLANSPGCAINPEKRAAFARKWSNRLALSSGS
jgi:hypothetical protein